MKQRQDFMKRLNEWREKSEVFFFQPATAYPLAALRIGLALCLLAQAFLLRGSVFDFFSSQGLLQEAIAAALRQPHTPTLEQVTALGRVFHFTEAACILSVCWFYVGTVCMFGFGYLTRFSTIATFFLHWVLLSTGSSTAYGLDLFAHVFLFYLCFMPSGDAFSLDNYLTGTTARISSTARLSLRILQLHLCLIYLSSGIEKARGEQWWNGEVLWRALSLPVYRQFNLDWLAYWPKILMVSGWMILAIETGYCIFIWPRATRKIWITAIVVLHLGVAIFLGLGLFGAIMCVLTASIFGVSAEPAVQPYVSAATEPEFIQPQLDVSFSS